ncbi:MAG: DUF2236 domain-containing protein [Nitrospirales bacterium]|nr:DUF2236 domain-containing protein [Nitrospira sp.]MDR4500998.1 DUF2236 domain-containing protein [Nitrospirales bacterium]
MRMPTKNERLPGKWSDDQFLDGLRMLADRDADRCFEHLRDELKETDFFDLFKELNRNDSFLSENIPRPLSEFFHASMQVPLIDGEPIDHDRIRRGQQVFMTHAMPTALVLLAKSLPEGYAAPSLSRVLSLSNNLTHHPYRRLLGVLQMVINVSTVGGFTPSGKALITVPKIRLLHSGVRKVASEHLANYERQFGVPINLEDMLGTVMGFSYLVIVGLQRLQIGLSDGEAEDYFYLWRIFGQMMGIHPEGQPNNSEYIPQNLSEAKEFYESYQRRHYVNVEDNPEGQQLAVVHLNLLHDLLPQTPLRRLGMQIVPRVYMEELIGKQGCERIGIKPVPSLVLTKWLIKTFPYIWSRLWNVVDRVDPSQHLHENISRLFFQGLINREFDGEVTFNIPDTLEEVKTLHIR